MDNDNFDLSEIVKSRESVRTRYLADLLKVLKIKSLVIGVGGAGNNTVSRMHDIESENINTLTINTDAHDLYYSNSSQKILIGKDICSGLGSGNDPSIGSAAAEEDVDRLSQVLNADVVFLTFGLGGGTGTGAAPIIAREAKKNNAMVVSFCSVPFKSEGVERSLRARKGLEELMKYSDTLIPIPNDNLLRFNNKLPILAGFKIMDEVLIRCIKEIINLINNCGLINIDYADVRKVLEKKGNYPSGLIGITESLGEEGDLIKKAKLALHNPLLEPDTNKVDKCIVSNASLKFGTSLNPALGSKIMIMALGRGPISPYVQAAIDGTEFPHSNLNQL